MSGRVVAGLVAIATFVVGTVVALGASSASLTGYAVRAKGATPVMTLATPTASPQPSPTPPARGQLGAHPKLIAAGSVLLALGDNQIFESDDAGKRFRSVVLPGGASSLVVAGSDSNRRLAGGATLLVSDDGGVNWRLPKLSPPGPGPFTPLVINPRDPDVWFLAAHGRLLRTRDGGISWREMAGISTDAGSFVVPTGKPDDFVVGAGGQVYELSANGQQIQTRSALPDPTQALQLAVVANSPTLSLVVHASDGKDYLDSGKGWQAGLPLNGPVASLDGKVAVITDGAGASAPAQIAVSTDLGKTWNLAQNLPTDQSVDAVVAMPAGTFIAYTFAGSILRSDDGISWSIVANPFRS